MNYLKNNWYWLVPLIIAVAGGVWYWQEKKKLDAGDTDKLPGGSEASLPLDMDVVLYQGINSPREVKQLQALLNAGGAKPTLSVDGRFGPLTAQALHKVKGVWSIALKDFK